MFSHVLCWSSQAKAYGSREIGPNRSSAAVLLGSCLIFSLPLAGSLLLAMMVCLALAEMATLRSALLPFLRSAN